MSYTELESGYQDLKQQTTSGTASSGARVGFYVGNVRNAAF